MLLVPVHRRPQTQAPRLPVVTSTTAPATGASLPAAVLWDMDGTLIDSEPYWIAEEHALVESFGGTWTDAHAHALVGNPLEVSAQYIIDHSPVEAEVTEVVDTLMYGVMDRIRGQVPWRPGALELLTALHDAGVRNALVTMSWRPLTDLVVSLSPAGLFDVVVTGDVVGHGKPHPEPYLTAARPPRCRRRGLCGDRGLAGRSRVRGRRAGADDRGAARRAGTPDGGSGAAAVVARNDAPGPAAGRLGGPAGRTVAARRRIRSKPVTAGSTTRAAPVWRPRRAGGRG